MKVASLILLLLFASPVVLPAQQEPAQNEDQADQGMLTLKQEVRNVVVDVVALDKKGNPVPSLTRSDFQVLENGDAQDIAFFEEHTGASEAQAPSASSLPAFSAAALPPDTFTNIEKAPATGPPLVLLFDVLNTRIVDEPYVRGQVLDYLKHIPAGTHMAIVTLGDSLKLVQGFTSDPAVLKAALDGSSYPAVSALTPTGLSTGDVLSARSSLSRFALGERAYDHERRAEMTLEALNALCVYLSAIPGRKSLIWFAGSIPWDINPDFSLATSAMGHVDYTEDLKRLADAMTVGRISVYPVDVRGLVTPPGYGADSSPGLNSGNMARNNGGSGRASGAGFAAAELHSQLGLAGSHMSMTNLAAATGGQAFYNSNGFSSAVDKVQSMGESYYTIAYSPRDKRYDGGYRELTIKIDRPQVKLEYRQGYFADDPARSAGRNGGFTSNPLHAVMQRGAPNATQIPFRVAMRLAARQPDPARPADRLGTMAATLKGPLARYDFHWIVDVRKAQFTSLADGEHIGEIDATVTAYDADGATLNSIYSTLPLKLSAAQYAAVLKSGLPMRQTLDLPAGLIYMRAGVVDAASGSTGATEFPILVQPDSSTGSRPGTAKAAR